MRQFSRCDSRSLTRNAVIEVGVPELPDVDLFALDVIDVIDVIY